MTELTIPPDASSDRVETLVREFLEIGDEVEVRTEEVTEEADSWTAGSVSGFGRTDQGVGVLELTDESRTESAVSFEDIQTISKLEEQ